jgi:hypothetical protein
VATAAAIPTDVTSESPPKRRRTTKEAGVMLTIMLQHLQDFSRLDLVETKMLHPTPAFDYIAYKPDPDADYDDCKGTRGIKPDWIQ